MMTDETTVTSMSDEAREQLVAELVGRVHDGGDLVGPEGLLAEVTKRVLETGLEVEMSEHLGYDKHAVEGRDRGNSRNGTRSKTLLTDIGPVDIDVPRDRDGSFDPKSVRKRQRRLGDEESVEVVLVLLSTPRGESLTTIADAMVGTATRKGDEVEREPSSGNALMSTMTAGSFSTYWMPGNRSTRKRPAD